MMRKRVKFGKKGELMMNDRYLFRAKRIDNGEWVEGNYVHTRLGREMIADGTTYFGINRPCMIDIDVNTLCLCTGFFDQDGKGIFEGDIIRFVDHAITENGYYERRCKGQVTWNRETASIQVTGRLSSESYEVLGGIYCEVIGNIFDNPELLEQEG